MIYMTKQDMKQDMIEGIDNLMYMADINNEINIGIDVDGILTKEVIGRDILELSHSEVEKAMLNRTPQKGIDILLDDTLGNNCNKCIITGRIERYRNVTTKLTTEWFDMYGIPYRDLTFL